MFILAFVLAIFAQPYLAVGKENLEKQRHIIPLDSFEKETYILARSGKGKTLSSYIGSESPWRIRRDEEIAIGTNLTPIPQRHRWEDFTTITENSPQGATEAPSKRIWNLPDLLDRLKLEGTIPKSVEYQSSSDTSGVLFVKEPTMISVSFAVGRKIRVVNSSRLVLICPFCSDLEIENQSQQAKVVLYSHVCHNDPKKGVLERFYLGNWLQRCSEEINVSPLGILDLSNAPYLPQALISQILGRKPLEIMDTWKAMYPININ